MSTNIPYSSSNCKKLPSKSFKNSFTIKVSCLLVTFFLFTFLESFWILRIKFYYIRSPLRLNFHIVDFFVIITHLWPWSKSKFNLKSDRVNLVAPASSIKRLLYLPNVRAIQYKLGRGKVHPCYALLFPPAKGTYFAEMDKSCTRFLERVRSTILNRWWAT